jgi:hypothetical protein
MLERPQARSISSLVPEFGTVLKHRMKIDDSATRQIPRRRRVVIAFDVLVTWKDPKPTVVDDTANR